MALDAAEWNTPDAQRALRLLAESAARAGGQTARELFRGDRRIWLKADRSEVSDADEAAQAAVIRALHAERPRDAIIGEEVLPQEYGPAPPVCPSNSALCWIIDPIDGTRNFVRGIPIYTCAVAAMLGGLPIAGAVFDPERDAMYSASLAEGLHVDEEAVPSPPRTSLTNRLRTKPVIGIPSNPVGPVASIVHRCLDRFLCRNFGSTALHLAMVAIGELDGMLADNPRLWDLAAGWVLITAVGGRMTTPAGAPRFPVDVSTYAGEDLPTIAASADLQQLLVSP